MVLAWQHHAHPPHLPCCRGDKLVDMGTVTGIQVFELDLSEVQQVRANMPMDLHRRYDIYGEGPHQAASEMSIVCVI